jgi:hypothetical protein
MHPGFVTIVDGGGEDITGKGFGEAVTVLAQESGEDRYLVVAVVNRRAARD